MIKESDDDLDLLTDLYPDSSRSDPRGPWRQRTWKLREVRDHRCQFVDSETKRRCRATSDLEFAHVKRTPLSGTGRGRGQTQRVRDIERHPEAYKLVCKKHHKEMGDPSETNGGR